MKRTIFVMALLCIFGTATITAQQASVFVGANAGVNLSKFKFTEDLSELYSSSSKRLGLNGGVVAGAEIHNFTVKTGLQYIQKGGRYDTDNFQTAEGPAFFQAKERQHYLSIPILVGYRKYLGGDNFAFSFEMGPSINKGLNGKLDETTEYFGSEVVEFDNYKVKFGTGVNEDYKKTMIGFQLSPGMVLKVNDNSKLNFNITWDFGTGDSFNPRYKDANGFFDTYTGNQVNHSTMFSIGYEYHFSFGDKY